MIVKKACFINLHSLMLFFFLTGMPGHVQTIGAFHDSKTDETRVVATAKTEVQLQPGASKLIAFSVPSDLSNS